LGSADPKDWIIGRLTHEGGNAKPFRIVYADKSEERFSDEPLLNAEDGALRHEIDIGYICPTRAPTSQEWAGGVAATSNPAAGAGAGAGGGKATKRAPERKGVDAPAPARAAKIPKAPKVPNAALAPTR